MTSVGEKTKYLYFKEFLRQTVQMAFAVIESQCTVRLISQTFMTYYIFSCTECTRCSVVKYRICVGKYRLILSVWFSCR
jgi:hypothetical protein